MTIITPVAPISVEGFNQIVVPGVNNYNPTYESINVTDFGAVADGVTDASTAFANAIAALPAGGVVNFSGWYYLASGVNVANGIILNGDAQSVGQKTNGQYNPSTISSALIINRTNPIKLNNYCAIQNTLIINQALSPSGTTPLPFASAAIAAAAVASFAGNAIIPFDNTNQFNDQKLENLLILGFAWAYNGNSAYSLNRLLCRRVYFDCTNGLGMQNGYDIPRWEDCEGWEFTTTNQSFTTNNLLQRSGIAFKVFNCEWMKMTDCFEYGFATGFKIEQSPYGRFVNCGADNAAAGTIQTIGFDISGSTPVNSFINCHAAAQTDTGFKLNQTTVNNLNNCVFVNCVAWGNVGTNGYWNILQGTYQLIGCQTHDNSTNGQVVLAAGVSGSIIGSTFGNAGNKAVTGNVTSIGNTQFFGNVYQNSTKPSEFQSWTPQITIGGSSTGITYSFNQGVVIRQGNLVTALFKILFTSTGGLTGAVLLTNLPYAITVPSAPGNHGVGYTTYYQNMAGITGPIIISGVETTTTATLVLGGTTGTTSLTNANLTNTTVIYGTLTYFN